MRRTHRLNPCDCLFNAFDRQLVQRGYAERAVSLVLDAVGDLDPARLAKGLRRALDAHPVIMSRRVVSLWRARPCWRFSGVPVAPKFKCHDLSSVDTWTQAADELVQRHVAEASDLTTPPLVSLWHIKGPGSAHRFALCWPHALMDMTGAHYFLSEIDRLADDSPAPYRPHLMQDYERLDPLAAYGLVGRLGLVREAMRTDRPGSPIADLSLGEPSHHRPGDTCMRRFLRRIWTPDKVQRARDNARSLASPGPVLYGRYVAACVLRAIHRVHAEYGRNLPYCGMSFPVPIGGIERRPIPANYLVWVNLRVDADRIADKRATIEDVDRQMREHFERRLDLSKWALLWLAGQLRNWQYQKLMGRLIRSNPYVTGYSFFREVQPPIRRFIGTQVTNLWALGGVNLQSGWNPMFCRFGDQWNFTLSWPGRTYSARVAERYADLIEEEVFGR